ncbi:uncharacterized protein trim33l isoform X1 [Misgurnus anguillicaudatus]|uniref:uncharacterized protein trim33l isoform X1 n=1 Tax=Misgurnus anguillicaudatus TaxID=75329 RepID=UPI003CCFADAB
MRQMFTGVQTGRPVAPRPDFQKAVCGSCAVCKTHVKSSTEPKLLPCLHAVCHACLAKTRKDEYTHECTLCAQSFCLSEVTECNVFEDSSDSNENPKCSACEETEVSGWCVQCEEALCSDCVSAHRRVKVTRDHELKPKKPTTGWMLRRRCPLHIHESLKFFCLVCNELTCKDCQLFTHRGHSFVQQEEAVGSQRERMLSLLESIRKQKETVSATLLLIEARLNDINDLKSHASKTLAQVVHSIYQSLLLSAREKLKEVEVLCADEVKSLMQRKMHLSKMEDCQDYISAFIDKILSTEGHCLLVHKKRIETQVIKLLSQMTCPPETMFELQLQLQKDLCHHIMTSGFMKIRKIPVPFKTKFVSAQTESGEGSNPPADRANTNSALIITDVHSLRASSNSDQSTEAISVQSQHSQSNSDSSNSVAKVPPLKIYLSQAPSVYSQSYSLRPTAPQMENMSPSAKPTKPWTFHYIPGIPASNQTSMQAHPVPSNSQAAAEPKLIPANNQTPVSQHPLPAIPVDNRSLVFTRTLSNLAKNQTPAFQHQLPANTHFYSDTQTHPSSQTYAVTLPNPTNYQTQAMSQPILNHNQSSIQNPSIPTNSERPVLTQPILVNNQTAVLSHPMPAIATNNQTPILAHQLSNIPTDTRQIIFAHPIQASILNPINTFATQPSIAFAVPSTINTHVNEVTMAYSDPPPSYPTSPVINTMPNPASSGLKSNLSVKALADSACDQDVSVSSTDFTENDNPENNLPTSTVSEVPEEPRIAHVPSNIQDLLASTTTKKRSEQTVGTKFKRTSPKGNQARAGHSSGDTRSEQKKWNADMPTSFRQLVESTYTPASLVDNLNDKIQLDSVPCGVSKSITPSVSEATTKTHDKTVQSDFVKDDPKEEDEEYAVTLEQRQQLKRFPRVSLVRLPISSPSCGQPLPEFHLFTDSTADQGSIFVQETQEGQIQHVWRWNEDSVPSKASSHHLSQESISPLSSEVQFCNVCQSAGATLQCFACGRAFHSDCHIPPIFVKPCEEWLCLLCLNVNDEIIVYGSEGKHSLNLQDQRKCEKLLLGLLCDENRWLLYNVKRHSNMAEFDIILDRLLGKHKPPYRTAAELVSDVWMLFDILSTSSEKQDEVVKLQNYFQQHLNECFGESLHASLLSHCSSKESAMTSDTASQSEKHKNTLKRMREFFTANSGTLAKKPCADKGRKKEDYGNSAATKYGTDGL